jgi:hypothetical protein
VVFHARFPRHGGSFSGRGAACGHSLLLSVALGVVSGSVLFLVGKASHRSPMQLDIQREIVFVEHDRGINFRSCPFTRTCWIMFLAFPLDFQTREIISQAVGLFGSVINWIDNDRCRSCLVLRCKVSLVSRIPRSIIISEGNPMGDHGHSWTVPVYVLNSAQNDVMAGDEDPVPGMGTLILCIFSRM